MVDRLPKETSRQTGPGERRRPRAGPLTVFIHVPKTAGTTFTAILRENFADGVGSIGNAFKGGGGFDPRPADRLGEVAEVVSPDMHVLAGHLPFGLRHQLPVDTRYVTFLRDPVERTLSQYYGFREHAEQRPLPGDGSLEAALAAGLMFDNLQTRMLSDAAEPLGALDERALEKAKHNLRRAFSGFGIAERFDESVVLLGHLLGLELALMLSKDQRVAERPRGRDVPDDVAKAARGANHYDTKLYRWAAEVFEQRVSEQGADFHIDLAALRAARTGDDVAQLPPGLSLEDVWPRRHHAGRRHT